mgnify:CR=1 FL=1
MPKCKEMLSMCLPAVNANFPLTNLYFKKLAVSILTSLRGFHAMYIFIYKALLLCSIRPRHHDKGIALQSEWCLTLTVSSDSMKLFWEREQPKDTDR